MDATVSIRILNMKYFYVIILSALIFSSCKPDDEFEGPSLEDQYGPFEILQSLTISTDSLHAGAGETALISAAFNKNVNWTITLTGANSGGQYVTSGYSINPQIEWNGSATVLPMFQEENCYVEQQPEIEHECFSSAAVAFKENDLRPYHEADQYQVKNSETPPELSNQTSTVDVVHQKQHEY